MTVFFSGISMVFHRLLEHSLEISVLIALVFLFKRMVTRRMPPWWHYSLWLVLLIRMLIPLEYENRLSFFNFIPSISPPVVLEPVDSLPSISPMPVPDRDAHGEFRTPVWLELYDSCMPVLWFAGASVFALYIVIRCLSFSWAVKGATLVTDGAMLALLAEAKSRMKIRRKVDVLVTDRVNCPSLFGYFRPRLLLPEGVFKDINGRDLTYAFMHELGHLKRHDIGIGWLMAFLQAFYWFNPLVWLAFHRMRLDQELACDALVLERMKEAGGRADYARSIVCFLERFCRNRQLPSLAGILESKVQMVSRITGIIRYKKVSGKRRVGAVTLLVVAMTFLFTFTGSLQRNGSDFKESEGAGDKVPDNLTVDAGSSSPVFMESAVIHPVVDATVNTSGFPAPPETTPREAPLKNVKRTLERPDEAGAVLAEGQNAPETIVGSVRPESSSRRGDDAVLLSEKDPPMSIPESKPAAMTPSIALMPEFDPAADTDNGDVFQPEKKRLLLSSSESGRTSGFESRMMASSAFVSGASSNHFHQEQRQSGAPAVQEDASRRAPEQSSDTDEILEGGGAHGKGGRKVYSPSEVDVLPRVALTYPPRYPYVAKRDNISGSITVQFVVSREGYAVSSKVVVSEPEGVFDHAALEAMRAYRFEPGTKDGKAVDVLVNLPIKFNLS
jgi:TonB family protein